MRAARPRLAALALLLALWPTAGWAASRFAPDLSWRTRTTPHFLIHYHQGLEDFARRVGDMAEAVYDRQTGRLHWTPRARTHVVLTDQTDLANGMATMFPYNTMVLHVTPPDGDAGLMLNPVDWDRLLLTHEYTHILHLDQAAGLPLGLRYVFGRFPLLFPNAFNPSWLLEGMAVREETLVGPGGRGRGALFAGLLRAQAAEDEVPPVSKANHPFHTWPGGHAPYLYGQAFLFDLARRQGEDAPIGLIAPYDDNLIPFLLAGSYAQATGEGLSEAWDGWRGRVTAAARAFDGGPPEGAERLTRTGYLTGGARVAPDGSAVAFTESTPDDHARIMLLEGDGPAREVCWRNGGRGLAFTPDGRALVFSQPELSDSFRLFDDLYRVDLATRRVRRLTRGARLREPDVAPDGRIVAVQAGRPEAGDTRLVLLDPDAAAAPVPLLEMGREAVFAFPRFSPDGRTVAVSVWRPNQGRHIALVDVATGKARLVTSGPANHADPAWTPDGKRLLYTSDADGTFDLYARDTSGGPPRRVTRELGGAFQPDVTPDGGHLLYTRLGGTGFDVYRAPLDPAAWTEAPALPRATPVAAAAPAPDPVPAVPAAPVPAPDPPPVPATDGPYHPYPAALPRFWFPVGYEEGPDTFWGLFTYGADPLGHHTYVVQAANDFGEDLPEAYITYLYDRWYPTVVLNLSQDIQGQAPKVGGGYGGWFREREATLDLVFPVNRINRRERLTLGVGVDDFGIEHLCTGCKFGANFTDYTVRVGATHDTTQRYGLGISPTDGGRLSVTSELADRNWGSDRDGAVWVLDGEEFAPLPFRAQVLHLRLTGATASGSRIVSAGGAPNPVEDAFERDFAVRGYPDRTLFGDRVARATLSWRFPLGLPEWAPWTLPLFFEKLHGRLFTEGATVRVADGRWKHLEGGGAEVGTDMVAGYLLPLTVRLGVARGLGDRGETEVYVRVEGSIL